MKRPLPWLALITVLGIALLDLCGVPLRKVYPAEEAVPLYEKKMAAVTGRFLSCTLNHSGQYSVELEDCRVELWERDELLEGGRILVYLEREPPAPLGSLLYMEGKLARIAPADDPGEFDAARYYLARGITLNLEASRVELAEERTDVWPESARRAREWLQAGLVKAAQAEDLGVLSAMVLGQRAYLDEETDDLFETAGISHILAVSGLHVSLAAGLVYALSGWGLSFLPWGRRNRFFSRRGFLLLRFLVTGTVLLFYMQVAGCSTSLRRAGGMFLLLCGAQATGRSYDLPSALSATALVIFWGEPYSLFQSSFQLSFGCMTAIGCIFPAVSSRLGLRGRREEALCLPLILHMTVLPLSLYHFYGLHPYSALCNFAAIPLAGFLLPFGFLTAVCGNLLQPLGLVFGGAAHSVLALLRGIAQIVEGLPGAVIWLGQPPLWKVLLYYAAEAGFLLGHVLICRHRERNLHEELLLSGQKAWRRSLYLVRTRLLYLLLLGLALSGIFFWKEKDGLHIYSLYVGQGDCHVLTDGEHTYLIDGGRCFVSPADKMILPFLHAQGLRVIDGICVSHADQDHINGLAAVLEDPGIRVLSLIQTAQDAENTKLSALRDCAVQHGCRLVTVTGGQAWTDGELSFEVVYTGEEASDENNASMVLWLRYGEFDALFTGDIGAEGEGRILEQEGLSQASIEYLKVAHHGSRFSTTSAFLTMLKPQAAVISYGRNNSYGHPHEKTLERLEAAGVELWLTGRDGCVELRAAQDGSFRVYPYHTQNNK